MAQLIEKPAREIITAGTSSQTVPAHSPIPELFLDAINGGADADKRGVVTPARIREYLLDHIGNPGLTPQEGKLDDPAFAEGEFLFRVINPAPPAARAPEQVEVARVLQGELKRVGCDPVSIDGNWGASSQRAIAQFNQQTHSSLDVNAASLEAIEAVRSKIERVCPRTCGPGERLAGDQCFPITCGHGLHVSTSGACVPDLPPQPRAASNPRPPTAAENPSPTKVRSHHPAAIAPRSDCFIFNGERFCE